MDFEIGANSFLIPITWQHILFFFTKHFCHQLALENNKFSSPNSSFSPTGLRSQKKVLIYIT